MAKINLTTQHNQENLSAVASLGLLICMVVTVVGIKLWWFKHRLSFEQTSTPNGAANGGSSPPVIVPRRSKQQRYKKDKRYSQQIYESVEVHGVFRQKREDDLEIQRPEQLPPVRIRKSSEGTSSRILPPPRTKRRDQVHSTAFEDLEIATPPLTPASSSDLTAITEPNTKINLTFEEFERQFKLKEIKHEIPEPPNTTNEVIEIPVPPLRLNRSTSTLAKPEKPQRFLKSSQSITIPEFHKIIEKRPTDFSTPKEDLTKIDDYEDPKVFKTFGKHSTAGYIKYEEVDNDLQEQYETDLNKEVENPNRIVMDSAGCQSPRVMPALKALRNERIIYKNDLDESPDIQLKEEYNFNKKFNKKGELQEVEFEEEEFVENTKEIKETYAMKFEAFDSFHYDNNEFQSIKKRGFKKFMQDSSNFETNMNNESKTPDYYAEKRCIELVSEYQPDKVCDVAEKPTLKDSRITQHYNEPEISATEIKSFENSKTCTGKENMSDFSSTEIFEEDFDNQFESWPQFEEKIVTPKVTIRRFNNQDRKTQSHFEENDDLEVVNSKYSSYNSSNKNENVNERLDSSELQDIEECQQTDNNKLYNKVRSFITAEPLTNSELHEVTFDSTASQNYHNEDYNHSAIKQRRPTGYNRENEYFVTFSDESDEEKGQNLLVNRASRTTNPPSSIEIVEIQSPKVNFKDSDNWTENENEKFTLNQRRPTGFIRPANNDDFKEISEGHVKFGETADIKHEQEFPPTGRPTGYIRNLETLDLADQGNREKYEIKNNDLNSKEVSHTGPTVRFMQTEQKLEDYESNTESLLKQRRPTGFIRQDELDQLEKQVSFQLDNEDNVTNSPKNEVLQQRRPTGFIRKEEITKQVNFQLNQNTDEHEETAAVNGQLKERRPTGYVSKKELKCLEQPAPIYQPSNDDNNNDFDDHLWQELEKDVAQDFSNNFEEEFARIRHSYELNEADFLELKDELHKSLPPQTLGFGKSIDDDWDNFEKLRNQIIIKPVQSPEEIKITFSDTDLTGTTSILKEHKLEQEDLQAKPRKSKVTFDFKTEEHVIPARKIHSEEDSDYDDEKHPPPVPQQRVSNINYNDDITVTPTVPIPKAISLFGCQISDEDDSWSAIRKHRNMTGEFQHVSTDSITSSQSPSLSTPPKPSYRNPMAQLAIQRAKEVRADMDGFKSRSINDRKPETSRRQKQKLLNLSNFDHEGTEA